MESLIREMEKITGPFWKPAEAKKEYQTPALPHLPCRKHFFNMSTCIVQQPTAQPKHRRGPDDYEPVNLNYVWDEVECEACAWDVHLTGRMQCRICSVEKLCSYKYKICVECSKKYF